MLIVIRLVVVLCVSLLLNSVALADEYSVIRDIIHQRGPYWLQDFKTKQYMDVEVQYLQNPIRLGDHRSFYFEELDTVERLQLTKEFGLQEITRGAPNDYEALLKIMHWTASRWVHSDTGNPSHYDALTILREAKKGGRFVCASYSLVFVQVATALGYPARQLSSHGYGSVGYESGHAQAEAWSTQYKKWILFDADNDIVYLKDGIPLNAAEVVHEVRTGNELSLKQFSPNPNFQGFPPGKNPIGYFYWVSPASFNSFNPIEFWQSDLAKRYPRYLWLDEGTMSSFPLKRTEPDNFTSDRSKLYFSVNQAFLQPIVSKDWNPVGASKAPEITLVLSNNMPWFSHYLVQWGQNSAETTNEQFVINPSTDSLKIRLTPINKKGLAGESGTASLTFGLVPALEKIKIEDILNSLTTFGEESMRIGEWDWALKFYSKKLEYLPGDLDTQAKIQEIKKHLDG